MRGLLETSFDVIWRSFQTSQQKEKNFLICGLIIIFFWRTKMRIVKTADDALHEINKNFMKLDDVDIAKSNQIVDFLKIDVVSYYILCTYFE